MAIFYSLCITGTSLLSLACMYFFYGPRENDKRKSMKIDNFEEIMSPNFDEKKAKMMIYAETTQFTHKDNFSSFKES